MMPLRDDHDAALARADALQIELDRERANDAEHTEEVARLEAELAAARDRLARVEKALGRLRPPRRAEEPLRRPAQPDAARRPFVAPVVAPDRGGAPSSSSGARIVVGLLAFVGVVLVLTMFMGHDSQPETQPPEPARVILGQPPFVADRLVAEGLAKIEPESRLEELHVNYVGFDGNLDPKFGRISVDTAHRPRPKPPDDPNRRTGAPSLDTSATDDLMRSCLKPGWTPSDGWHSNSGSCISFTEPVGTLGCTVTQILARARTDGAPGDALATLTAAWAIYPARWEWKIEVNDQARGVSFSRSYPDDCRAGAAPPVVPHK